jgi:ABC-type nickel/cobalt efflux system permease component RcnA
VARPGAAGTEFQRSSVPAEDVTHELRQYPDDLLNSPLNVREARLAFVPGAAAARPLLAGSGVAVLDRTRSAFAELANGAELTPAFILFALGVAVVLGAAHALQPGHGKTVVAAYLVGSRGTAKHALFLGATVTATHTAGVYALGVVTLFLSQYILPERLYPILEIVSGLLVVAIGIYLFGSRLVVALGIKRGHDHDHGHTHSHAGHTHDYGAAAAHGPDAGHTRHLGNHHHAHPHVEAPHDLVSTSARERAQRVGESHSHSHGSHSHDHAPTQSSVLSPQSSPVLTRPQSSPVLTRPQSSPVLTRPQSSVLSPQSSPSWKSLLALGVSGGLLPCPEALMVLLITIAAHRVLFGLLLIVAFSTGLAAVLVGFGLLLVFAKGFFSRLNLSSGLAPRVLPVMSALVIVIAGGVITAQALPQVL